MVRGEEIKKYPNNNLTSGGLEFIETRTKNIYFLFEPRVNSTIHVFHCRDSREPLNLALRKSRLSKEGVELKQSQQQKQIGIASYTCWHLHRL